jgi:hypothetical protein
MTLQDLYKAVSQLGFEDSLGDDSTERFIYAANRALIEVNSLRPRRKRVDINHRVPTNLLFSEPKQIEKTETLTFTARNAKSFYFEVSGEGSFEVGLCKKDGSTISVVSKSFSTKKTFDTYKGFIKYNEAFIDKLMEQSDEYTGEVYIEFGGDYSCIIRNLAMYDRVYSSNVDDIPQYGEKIPYNVSALVTDFERFDSPPLDLLGNHLFKDYTIENNTLYLPIEKQGTYTVNYLHKVTKIPLDAVVTNTSTNEDNIDLEEDLAALLPNLIAAYVWLDDEPDKSQYYYNLYLQRAEYIRSQVRSYNPVEFESVYGW